MSEVIDRLVPELAQADEDVREAGKAALAGDNGRVLELLDDVWLQLRDLAADLKRELDDPEPGR